MSDAAPAAAAIIHTTAPSVDAAVALARALVEAQLAACVQMAPITSVYTWKNAVQTDAEVLLTIKTRARLFEDVCAAIKAQHSYETPEIVMTPVTAIDADYAAWLNANTRA